MADKVVNLTNIDQRTKDKTTGFIRIQCGIEQCPDLIIATCVLYLAMKDQFDADFICKDGIRDNKQCITLNRDTQTIKQSYSFCHNNYLKNIVESGRHEWKFKLIYISRKLRTLIGIWRYEKGKEPKGDKPFTQSNKGYCFDTSNAKKSGENGGLGGLSVYYATLCKSGDIIDMILDFNDLSLSFRVNGKDFGKSHDVTKAKYKAVVYTNFSPCEVQLISYVHDL